MKRIIRKILKEEFNNRMSREDYVDKVVEYLVDDTIIDYDDEIHFPFPTLSRSRIFLLRYSLPFEVGFVFAEYCIDTYGLTNDEIGYVWKEYRNIILDKINNSGSINESTGKMSREGYLNKVVEYLVDDTTIDFKEKTIIYPYRSSSSYSLFLRSLLPSSSISLFLSLFSKYCKDNYGLTDEEIDYVWNRYTNIIIDKINNSGSINESVDRRDEYLNKIVDFLVDDTIIDFKENNIRFPFLPRSPSFLSDLLSPFSLVSFTSLSSFNPFSKYCKDMYGLTENEMDYVWKEYKNIILDKINNTESINESVDRMSREDYLNKILDYLVEDTIIDFKEDEIHFPFPSSISHLSFHPLASFPYSSLFTSTLPYLPLVFSEYCQDTYGLTENEIDYVWEEYKNIINEKINKINTKGSINESTGKMSREDYLNKILDYLVEDTIIDYEEREIKYPHLPPSSSSPLSLRLSLSFSLSFSEYCQVTYGLTENEMDYVWDRYKNIIWDRYKNIKLGKINEGFPDGLW